MKKILIIENEKDIAELEREYLELDGFKVDIENNGTMGLFRALEEDYDFIILGLLLPGINGFEICKRIRKEKDTPIMVISDRKEAVIFSLDVGADDFMKIPFNPQELLARVKAHLRRYEHINKCQQIEKDIITIRDLKIDLTARRILVNDEEKFFTTKEFDLLVFFAKHPNHVFTREELFEKVWRMESVGNIATVTVHVKKIREKIEYDMTNPQYIETLWGIGYRFKS